MLFGGGASIFRVEYSPSNPVVNQEVTFTLTNPNECQDYSIVPFVDAVFVVPLGENGNTRTGTFTYEDPGTYHISLDVDGVPCIPFRSNNDRELVSNFEFGPVGGPYTMAVLQGNVFCSPLIVAAPAPIPTMTQWGILVLLLLSAIVGVVYKFSSSPKVNIGAQH